MIILAYKVVVHFGESNISTFLGEQDFLLDLIQNADRFRQFFDKMVTEYILRLSLPAGVVNDCEELSSEQRHNPLNAPISTLPKNFFL
jgi:hypothetical protein